MAARNPLREPFKRQKTYNERVLTTAQVIERNQCHSNVKSVANNQVNGRIDVLNRLIDGGRHHADNGLRERGQGRLEPTRTIVLCRRNEPLQKLKPPNPSISLIFRRESRIWGADSTSKILAHPLSNIGNND